MVFFHDVITTLNVTGQYRPFISKQRENKQDMKGIIFELFTKQER